MVLYEGFNYGGTGGQLSAQSGSALGLDGTSYTASSAITYEAAGLSFGDLSVTGGNANLPWHTSTAYVANRGVDFSITAGTLYSSFLFQAYSDGGSNNGISPVMFGSTQSDNTVELAAAGNTGSVTTTQFMGLKSYGVSTVASGSNMSLNTNYLILTEVTNMGAAASESQTVNMWALSLSQFQNLKLGGLTTTELNSATLGTGDSEVYQRLTYTFEVVGSNNISLANTESMTLFSYRSKYLVDEIRIGNESLDEVTPIPEPGTFATLAVSLMIFSTLRRRRRS